MTPEEVQQAIKDRKTLFYLEVYSTSASTIRPIEPAGIEYSPAVDWKVTTKTGTRIPLERLYPSRADALLADADRLDAVARECSDNASALRRQVKWIQEGQDGV